MPTVAKTSAKSAAKSKGAGLKTASKAPQAKAIASPTAALPKPAKRATQAEAKPAKPAKLKLPLVRDSFTMPAADFDLIAAMKLRALKLMRSTKKSELLRAGLHALAALNDTRFCSTLNALTPLKPGRPKKAD